ncbi:MAG: hypothetical protein HY812_03695 [Planctomycetes bacterium]|nr:hypothetical protein [Planctomycetota bacterium]
MASDSSEARKQAERLYRALIDRVDRGERPDFEAPRAAEAPEVEGYLRRLLREREKVSRPLSELKRRATRNKALAATAAAALLAALLLAGRALVERSTARTQARRAGQNATLAERRAEEAESARARVPWLSDVKTLADLKARACGAVARRSRREPGEDKERRAFRGCS